MSLEQMSQRCPFCYHFLLGVEETTYCTVGEYVNWICHMEYLDAYVHGQKEGKKHEDEQKQETKNNEIEVIDIIDDDEANDSNANDPKANNLKANDPKANNSKANESKTVE